MDILFIAAIRACAALVCGMAAACARLGARS
jgi:hypothetical protein